jgi:hypothetical protein
MRSRSLRLVLSTSLLTILLFPTPGLAWGERGHDLITRAAARLCALRAQEYKIDPSLCRALVFKEHLLGHLSNVPDIVWKASPKAVTEANYPTHFIDLDLITTPAKGLSAAPLQYATAASRARESSRGPQDMLKDVGTAPWRAEQLERLLASAWKERAFDRAILLSGLLSHFVADLTMPFHATSDYDGWESGHGGIHSWYESEMVRDLPLAFDADVFDEAADKHPFKALQADIRKNGHDPDQPLIIAWALALNAHHRVEKILALDSSKALLIKSELKPVKREAKRREISETRETFRPLLREDLALAADALLYFWARAWQEGGKPSLGDYRSWYYPLAPDFIPVDYASSSR